MKRSTLALLGAAALVALGCGVSSPDKAEPGTKDLPIAAASSGSSAAPPPAPDPNTIKGDGTFAVGSQIKPGTYRTVVPSEGFGCYWARLKAADGELSSIIANDNSSAGAQSLVTIKPSDKYFETRGCGTWKLTP